MTAARVSVPLAAVAAVVGAKSFENPVVGKRERYYRIDPQTMNVLRAALLRGIDKAVTRG